MNVHLGVAAIVGTWPELINLVQSGRIKGDDVFTHEFELSEGEEAYRKFNTREDNIMKVLMRP